MSNTLKISILSYPLWPGLSYLYKKFVRDDDNFASRYYSSVHACISSCNAASYLLGYTNLSTFTSLQGISVSYALYDSINLCLNRDYTMVLYHALMVFGNVPYLIPRLSDGLYFRYNSCLSRLFLAETSTPFLNNCWVLLKTNRTKSLKFKLNVYVTLLSSLIFRVINTTYINYLLYQDGQYIYLPVSLTFMCLNYYWFYKMIRKKQELS